MFKSNCFAVCFFDVVNNHGHLTVHCVEFSGIGQRGGEELGVGGEEVSGGGVPVPGLSVSYGMPLSPTQ